MRQIIIEATEYLKSTEDIEWKPFTSFAVTEKMIPKTSKEIRKYVLKKTNDMLKANKSSQADVRKLAKKTPPIFLDYNFFEQYIGYFNVEKECLIAIRKLLTTRRKISKDKLPLSSGCGILLSAIENIHSDNESRLVNTREDIINLYSTGGESNDTNLSPASINPTKMALVKNMTCSINKHLK